MKHVAVWLMLLTIPVLQPTEKKHKYKGPQCLGPFCFGHPITRKRIPEVLGAAVRKGNPYCFQSGDGKIFLSLRLTEEYYAKGGVSTELMLSDFPNCVGKYGKVATSVDPLTWKTREDIGLGSDEQDVLRAYGKPPEAILPKKMDMSSFVMGYDEKTAKLSRYAGKVLWYDGSDELERAVFFIRDGKVSAIAIEDTE